MGKKLGYYDKRDVTAQSSKENMRSPFTSDVVISNTSLKGLLPVATLFQPDTCQCSQSNLSFLGYLPTCHYTPDDSNLHSKRHEEVQTSDEQFNPKTYLAKP